MRKFFVSFLLMLFASFLQAQTQHLYELERKIVKGDIEALYKMATYLDSNRKVREMLGHHTLYPKQSEIARRIIDENILFMKDEINIFDSTLTAKILIDFLKSNRQKLNYSKDIEAFFIKHLNEREVAFSLRKLTSKKLKELNDKKLELLNQGWVTDLLIDINANQKDPVCLLTIATELFRTRNRWDRYNFRKKEYIELIELLIHAEIAVEDGYGKFNWHIDEEYSSESSLNLLIFFSKEYKNYVWNNEQNCFVNSKLKVEEIGEENILFQQLSSKNDSIAMASFVKLTNMNAEKVGKLADEYEALGFSSDKNWKLPIFPYRFLKSLSKLTKYCRDNNIDYNVKPELAKSVDSLKGFMLGFKKRRHIENNLIKILTLNNITAFEYYCAVNENDENLTYSAGRILDIFYSKHFNEIIADKKQLELYLKKSKLFDEFGIIGVCNNYLLKFNKNNSQEQNVLKSFQSEDIDVSGEINKVFALKTKEYNIDSVRKRFDGNEDYWIDDPKKSIDSVLLIKYKNSYDSCRALEKVISKINYFQIDTIIYTIQNIKVKNWYDRYSFLKYDFGFFADVDLDDKAEKENFLNRFHSLNQFDFYCYWLSYSDIDYKTNDSLDFDKIYELLKYSVVQAFVGGGGSKQNNESFALTKILELHFNTSLGFPQKLCHSASGWACSNDGRVDAWMDYLKKNKYLKQEHKEPVTFRRN